MEKTQAKKSKPGRPATGRKTEIIRASVPKWLYKEAKETAFRNGETFSGLISRAIQAAILSK